VIDEMLVIVPTRSRPHNVERQLQAFHTTCRTNIYVVYAIDDDDPAKDEYYRVVSRNAHGGNVTIVSGPRRTMVGVVNETAKKFAGEFRWVGFMGDDHVPRTEGWDARITDVLETKVGVVYPDDGFQRERLGTTAFMTSELVGRLGYMIPQGLRHMFADDFWMLLGNHTSLTYLPDVMIEHMHPDAGKDPRDALYAETNTLAILAQDQREFQRYVLQDWPVEKLKLVTDGS
jgi:hypothetical protein